MEENKKEEIIEQQNQQPDSTVEQTAPGVDVVEELTQIADEKEEPLGETEIFQDVEETVIVQQVSNAQDNNVGFEPVIAPKKTKEQKSPDYDMVSVSPVEFISFEDENQHLSDDPKANLDIMQDVKMHITVELGRARSSVKKILDLSKGSIVELNKVAGEQVELYANGRFIAYGEVIVIEDKFGLRVTNISNQNIHNL